VLGKHGETEAYFYLKTLGYQFVATNFRVPHNRGEIDLIGWDNGTLCFVEVKTRSDDSFAPPSTAVTLNKRRNIISVARRYLRRLPAIARRPAASTSSALLPRIPESSRDSRCKRERSAGTRASRASGNIVTLSTGITGDAGKRLTLH
jgi:Holliday junction resolvase-like predicted endonuclease